MRQRTRLLYTVCLLASAACGDGMRAQATGTVGNGNTLVTNTNNTAFVNPNIVIANPNNPSANPNSCSSVSAQVGQSCTLGGGGQGVNVCQSGTLTCMTCTPGTLRRTACTACNLVQQDVCDANGNWLLGNCDTCGQPSGCDAPNGCNPGDSYYQRCDSYCAAGDSNCASSGWGQLVSCGSNCQWSFGTCQVYGPTCNSEPKVVSCDHGCGTQIETCDGYFMSRTPCQSVGVCQPGESHQIPCTDPNANTCSQGSVSSATCNNSCQWDPPTSCSTPCAPGATQAPVQQNCVGLVAGACGGTATVTPTCVQTTRTTCDSSSTTYTYWSNQVTDSSGCTTGSCGGTTTGGGTCTQVCAPGATTTQSCSAACGLPGTQTVTCTSNGCGYNTSSCSFNDTSRCSPSATRTSGTCANCSRTPQQQICTGSCVWENDPNQDCIPCD